MNPEQKAQLIGNLASALSAVPREIQLRQIVHFHRADPAYGAGVARSLGIDLKEMTHKAA